MNIETNPIEQSLKTLLDSHATLKLATSGDAGPWIAAAFFAEEGVFRLRLLIEARGRTMANLVANPQVAVMIESGDPVALFAQAEARAVVRVGPSEAFRAALVAKTPSSAPLVGMPGLVPVEIEVQRWRLTDVKAGWLPARDLLPATSNQAACAGARA
jgi:hypothetical protein